MEARGDNRDAKAAPAELDDLAEVGSRNIAVRIEEDPYPCAYEQAPSEDKPQGGELLRALVKGRALGVHTMNLKETDHVPHPRIGEECAYDEGYNDGRKNSSQCRIETEESL